MVIRRFIALVSVLIVFGALPAHAKDTCVEGHPAGYRPVAERIADGSAKAMLWRITRCGYPDNFVFGTMHSDSPRLKPLLDDALYALSKSQRVALELEVTPAVQQAAITTMTLPPAHGGLYTIIPRPLFDLAVVKLGPILRQNADQINRYTPWGLALIVQYPKPEADGITLDQKIENEAKKQFKRRRSLETIEGQMGVFTSLSAQEQQQFLEATLNTIEKLDQQLAELFTHYINRDLLAIEQMSESMFDDVAVRYPALAKKLRKDLIEKRNDTMVKNSLMLFRRSTLVAVGALHLPGETGLLNQFEAEGFTVMPVDAVAEAAADAATAKSKPRFKSVFDD